MSKRIKHISAVAIVVVSMLAYHFSKDIYKMGVKDGKTTKQALAKK